MQTSLGPETPPLAPPLERLVCKTGELSIDKDVPLVRIRLLTDNAGFALILTISHAIGDGATSEAGAPIWFLLPICECRALGSGSVSVRERQSVRER